MEKYRDKRTSLFLEHFTTSLCFIQPGNFLMAPPLAQMAKLVYPYLC